jgi:uncharacterized damage-inducible protein DinB
MAQQKDDRGETATQAGFGRTMPAMEERFRQVSADYLGSFLGRIEGAVALLTEDQVWWRPNAVTNSVGNHILHLQGNLSQWVLAGLGGIPYERHRKQEFQATGGIAKQELLRGLRDVIGRCQAVVRALPSAELLRPRQIQGVDTDGTHAVVHIVEHTSYHAGQIVHIAKELLGPTAGIEFFPQHKNE